MLHICTARFNKSWPTRLSSSKSTPLLWLTLEISNVRAPAIVHSQLFYFWCVNVLVIAQYKPTDATTNPSLLYAAAQIAEYKHLIDDAITFAKGQSRYSKPDLAFPSSSESKDPWCPHVQAFLSY